MRQKTVNTGLSGLETSDTSLFSLKAFEASARHLSFGKAAGELGITQAAIRHQVKVLEKRLNIPLFYHYGTALALSEEGAAILTPLTDFFVGLNNIISALENGRPQQALSISVAGTFAMGWLLPRLPKFNFAKPFVDLRLFTNDNKIELSGQGIDYSIHFGGGSWEGLNAERLLPVSFTPLCTPAVAEKLADPSDLSSMQLLRSYNSNDWPTWFTSVGLEHLVARGPRFDCAWMMVQMAMKSGSVALAPRALFVEDIVAGRLVQPFSNEINLGAYWLTNLRTKPRTAAMAVFRDWLLAEVRLDL